MKHFFRQYVEFLRRPEVARLMLLALISRMPVGMVAFSMLMFLREKLGAFSLAGSAVGIYFVAMAVCAPIQGRVIDRVGPRGVLIVTGVVHPLAMLAVLLFAYYGFSFGYVAAASAVCGAFATPIITLTRTLWRQRFDDEHDRRRAFALDAVMLELNFTLGPVICAAVLASAGATWAFGLSIVVVVLAAALFVVARATRHFKLEAHAERHLFGPLTERRLVLLFLASFGLTTCFGLLEVGYPAYATQMGVPAAAGLLLGMNALGSATGGAVYGGLHLRMSYERQFAAVLALMAVPLFMHLLFEAFAAWIALAYVTGLLIAPAIASQSVLVSRLAPSKYAAEAFTWSSTFIVAGLGTGMAVGGTLTELAGVRPAFATGGAIVCAMALLALLLRSPGTPRAAPAEA
ncbi:MFS transporter [Usitatibacter palustris]|uniref:MFS transporter n=1 Tax=Usitatibacter palustris TaxID=2732487 RepID=UPI0014891014|nr:MFS transporter [Usitatibacter palustris]